MSSDVEKFPIFHKVHLTFSRIACSFTNTEFNNLELNQRQRLTPVSKIFIALVLKFRVLFPIELLLYRV